jgi:single-stranded-DNA-specific exonuclease
MNEIIEILSGRLGLVTDEQKDAFLRPDFDTHTHDPFLLSDMDVAVERLHQAITNKETIGIYTDYDCDGIPGGVVMADFFRLVGYDNFHVYIPDRQSDGYGLSNDGIDLLKDKGCTVIITIDLGITAVDSTLYAKDLGIDIIITDHHLPHAVIPDAYAIINPKRVGDMYPFKDLCGTGVLYKLVCGFLTKYRDNYGVGIGAEKWMLDMVGLATLADMVPLVGENRVFAYFGLLVMKKTKRLGLKKLFSLNNVKLEYLVEDDLSFTLVPRINAASRMGDAYLAYRMLSTVDPTEAESLAKELESLNNKRKSHVAGIMKDIKKSGKDFTDTQVIVIGDPTWRPGVLGLVAGKLVEEYQKPVFVWGGNDEGDCDVLKGSCRAGAGMNVVDIMTEASSVFDHFGGHSGAGGFSLSKRNVHDLDTELNCAYDRVKDKHNNQNTDSDGSTTDDMFSVSVAMPSRQLFDTIQQFAPFGFGNTKPALRVEHVTIESFKQFGKSQEHLEVICRIDNASIKALAFFKHDRSFTKPLSINDTATLICHIEMSYFIRPELRLRIIDIY